VPQPEFVAALERFRRALLARERAAAVRLVNAYGRVYARLQRDIEALADEIATMDAPTKDQVRRMARYRSLLRQIEEEVNRFAVLVEAEIDEGARAAIQAAAVEARTLAQLSLPGLEAVDAQIMATWNRLPTQAVETLLGFLADDAPLKVALRTRFGQAVAEHVGQKLLEGVALGFNPRKTAEAVRKAAGVGLTDALRLSRTTQVYAYREATRANWLANSHIVRAQRWRSSRDGRVCGACLAMDGTVLRLDEVVNGHWSCRCTPEPITVTYAELGLDVPEPERDTTTGEEWFKQQPATVQREILGKGKYEAWRAGKFEFRQLATERDDPVWGSTRIETPLKELLAA
jgi:SPP1 gp7 family putative phage head morphogenesis protein